MTRENRTQETSPEQMEDGITPEQGVVIVIPLVYCGGMAIYQYVEAGAVENINGVFVSVGGAS